MIGYGVIGGGNPFKVFQPSLWIHIRDFSLINKNHSGSSRYEVSHEAEHDKRKQKER